MPPLRTLSSLGLLLTVACASAPRPGDPGYPFNVVGSYTGRFLIDNQPFDANIQLRTTSGGRVSGAFRVVAPFEIEGQIDGVVADDLLRLTVRYRNPQGCDGRIEGILSVEEGGGTFEGPVTVTDCGSPTAGRMSFRRRS
ncbi:MAG: hypothetical protein O2958_03110 [Gemmatimonadetes bacterium]|nr:hypothetical protein [Gemmatimonadota bacterium]MDA1102307.1 hypothetical protein [Gemmatimonadota bacterium]